MLHIQDSEDELQVPESISCLEALQDLELSNHYLAGLPMAMAGCRQLSRLVTEHCKLQGWPDVLRRLTALVELHSGANSSMCELMMHDAFEGLEGLQVLDLSGTGGWAGVGVGGLVWVGLACEQARIASAPLALAGVRELCSGRAAVLVDHWLS